MIITIDSLKSAIRKRKTWESYDHDKFMDKILSNAFLNDLIREYDNYTAATSNYRDYSARRYISSRYNTYDDYDDIARSVYRPIDPRDIRVDYPNLRSDIGTYWGFQ